MWMSEEKKMDEIVKIAPNFSFLSKSSFLPASILLRLLDMAKKRKDDGHRETQSGDNKKRKGTYAQKGQLSGPGILLTTVRRKERKAGLELIEFLDDLVLDLYPDLDLSIPEPRTHISEVPLDDDDDLDALKNGTPPVAISSKDVLPDIPAIKAPKSSIEDDIEAQLQAELDELRPKKHKEHRNGSQTNADRSTTATTTSRKAFTLIDPEVECLMFVSVAWPMDPVKLSCALLDRVAKTGQVRGHFIQRLSPIYLTGRADGMDKIEKLAAEVMEKHYPSSTDPLSVSTLSPPELMRLV
jgi:hypothetical protein